MEAGADAVYLGLTSLNARRRARNFSASELARACTLAHGRNRRVYLTLNTDVAQRELEEAARMLELSRSCGVDAVLVRDPALLAMKPCYPELGFHFSTQACITSRADVEAAKVLGVRRVVLAREMTLEEIAAASSVDGVETEVFVQGALCFSVSGRCLLASWVGGRSGNRGQCTSPCRVPWTADGRPAGTPLSMHDLSLVARVADLRAAGVRALKIEGRLKTPAWVRAAVSLYRKAIDGAAPPDALAEEAQALGRYTGRILTSGFLDGHRTALTGISGREASMPEALNPERHNLARNPEGYSFALQVGKRIACHFSLWDDQEDWELPRAEIKRAAKAIPVSQLLDRLRRNAIDDLLPIALETNSPGELLVPRAANAIEQRVAAAVRRSLRARKKLSHIELPGEVESLLEAHAGNRPYAGTLMVGGRPDRARIAFDQAEAFLAHAHPTGGVIVEGLTLSAIDLLLQARLKAPIIAALPAVIFDEDVPRLASLLDACRERRVRVEVNGWGAWGLASKAGVPLEGGPGLGALSSLAAGFLKSIGLTCITASIESDEAQLAELLRTSPLPCSVYVFGRPALATTRVDLSRLSGQVLEDRRDVHLRAHAREGLWQLRPEMPFELRGTRGPKGAAHLVVDLVGSDDPLRDWTRAQEGSRFNLERTLA